MVSNSKLVIEDVDLEADSCFASNGVHLRVIIEPTDIDGAGVGLQYSREHVDRGGFACSVVSQKTKYFALEQTEA